MMHRTVSIFVLSNNSVIESPFEHSLLLLLIKIQTIITSISKSTSCFMRILMTSVCPFWEAACRAVCPANMPLACNTQYNIAKQRTRTLMYIYSLNRHNFDTDNVYIVTFAPGFFSPFNTINYSAPSKICPEQLFLIEIKYKKWKTGPF